MIRLCAIGLGGVVLAGAALAQGGGSAAAPDPTARDTTASVAAAGDPAAGKALAGQCRTCHGLDGISRIAQAPHIGGDPAAYLEAQLRAFHDGTRQQEMMSIIAAGLTDAQMADLAAWYAAQTPVATLAADPGDAPALCSGCHGADGIGVAEDAPTLAGDTSIYTLEQLKAFRSGQRVHAVMSAIAADLTDEEMRAAADWYAAVEVSAPPD